MSDFKLGIVRLGRVAGKVSLGTAMCDAEGRVTKNIRLFLNPRGLFYSFLFSPEHGDINHAVARVYVLLFQVKINTTFRFP